MPKIAIIEDELAISQMYRIKFEAGGYEVETAENGKTGLELVEKFKPDVILLDLMMPEMTGPEMLQLLRATDWGKNIKVIVLTNVGQDEAKQSLGGQKVDAFIIKAHFTPKEVSQTVAKVLGLAKA